MQVNFCHQTQLLPNWKMAFIQALGCVFVSFLAPLRWSQSLSKDTGLGSTTQTNDTPMSYRDLIHTPMMEKASGKTSLSVLAQETDSFRAKFPTPIKRLTFNKKYHFNL